MDKHDQTARMRAAMDELRAALDRAEAFLAKDESSQERRLPLAQQPAAFQRAQRLTDYATKPLQTLVQFDVWQHVEPGDPIVIPDADGDTLFTSTSLDFRRFDGVRVQFPPGRAPLEVIRALQKVIHWIDTGADIGEDGQPLEIRSPTNNAVDELYKALQYNEEIEDAT